MNNGKMDVQSYIIGLVNETMNKWQDSAIKNIDKSKLNKEYAENMLKVLSKSICELDILLTMTEEIGGFCSSYPKKCLESLNIMQTILEMEIKG